MFYRVLLVSLSVDGAVVVKVLLLKLTPFWRRRNELCPVPVPAGTVTRIQVLETTVGMASITVPKL